MSRSPQLKFDDSKIKSELRFGGTLLRKAKNRHARPVSSRYPMHVILKSSKAKGRHSFGLKNAGRVKAIVNRHCDRYGVKLIEYSNNYSHLHLLLKFPSRAVYLRFIRSITGHLALAVSGAKKLNSLKAIFGAKGFFDMRPFTRVVRSFRGYKIARDYITLNHLEALDIIPKRKGRLKDLRPGEENYFPKERLWSSG